MTAVNPIRLRFQVQGVLASFSSPEEFHHKLRGLFSLYANYALRFGETAPSRPLIPMYHLPHPVLRQLKLDLQHQLDALPEAALAAADELWNDPYYEIKYIAILILGTLPLDDPQPVRERIQQWLTPNLDQVLKSDLLSMGTLTLQDSFPDVWEALVLSYLSEAEPERNALGIQALAEGAKRPEFKNLPAVFRLASPFIRTPHSAFSRDLEGLVEILARLHPQETGYFLRQTLSLSVSPATARLIKNCLSSFPEDIQRDLKSALTALKT